MSAGNLITSGQRRNIRILGEINSPKELNNFVVKSEFNKPIYLKDIAEITFKDTERTTFARNKGETVVMLDVKKRSGENMVEVFEKINKIIEDAKTKLLPANLKVSVANDQAPKTLGQVDDLVNNIVFGIILVVTVLMFFLDLRMRFS